MKAPRVCRAFYRLLGCLRAERQASLLACLWPLIRFILLARARPPGLVRVVVAEPTTWSRSELWRQTEVGRQVRTVMRHMFPRANSILAVSQGAVQDLARFAQLLRQSFSIVDNPVVGYVPAPAGGPHAEPCDWCEGSHWRVLAVRTLNARAQDFSIVKAVDQNLQLLLPGVAAGGAV